MPSISTTMAKAMFTKKLIDFYRENTRPSAFLRSFFPTKEAATRYLSIEVMRGTEKIAVDVLRGTEGNRNKFSRSTEKVIDPPYYREYFDITELDLYDRLFASETIDDGVFTQFLEAVADKLMALQAKIERSYELQCAQVLQTGIVTVADGTNIDFKRRAASMVDYSSTGANTPWTTTTVDPYAILTTAGGFLRTVGKSNGGVFNMILGSLAGSALFNNPIVQKRGPLSNINFDSLRAPQREAVGANSMGVLTAGDYKYNLWSYPEFYDKDNGDGTFTSTPYVDPKNVIVIPENPRFVLGFAAVPQLIDVQNPSVIKGAYVYGDYVDRKKHTHEYDVRSAGVAIPTAVDQIWTAKVV